MPDNITRSIEIETAINNEVESHGLAALKAVSLGGLANSLALNMLNNTTNQYSSQTLANSAMVSACNKILDS